MKALNSEFFKDDEKIAVIASVWKPELKKHSHDFFEITFITKGNGYHVINNNHHTIKQGNLFLITPKSEHNLLPANPSEAFEWINVLFFPSVISTSLIDMVDTTDILKVLISSESLHYNTKELSDIELQNDAQEFQHIFEEMQQEFQARKAGYQNLLKGYLEILLVKIFRAYFYDPTSDTEISQKVLNYLREKSFQNDLNLEELAKRTFYSPQYFRKLFKSKTGIPLSTFIRQKRLDYAKQLLENTDLSISGVMEKAGFNDTKSFYAAFKSAYGVTPANMRNR
ncbi:helix-turn-helix domain-containing protein [Candidatus Borkfalkia ceftriaxoniphila]|jgi:transcriptional regulator containing an amidase domain and an araC-type DNA-binding HTH domain|uniref:Helix-turn-helix domain-containing protein n=1 Tax=Candidatus Borkfalkia ceftriaxoniphila TaxID=2508949 RepID=A0A4Q2KCW6_9FIRM|nr:AraC family transcriptional regulator [Candidatus Borkfalkia ceftriaxoniphila]RXZ61131.1 helix-turn-helix domain-containing protein [Candidatus Borkfalkia ceftriaxoniphila]